MTTTTEQATTEQATTEQATTTEAPAARRVRVIYADTRNSSVDWTRVTLPDGDDTQLPLNLAIRVTEDTGRTTLTNHLRVIRVIDLTGDKRRDEVNLLNARAELFEQDAAILRANPNLLAWLAEDGHDVDTWIREHYDTSAVSLREQAASVLFSLSN